LPARLDLGDAGTLLTYDTDRLQLFVDVFRFEPLLEEAFCDQLKLAATTVVRGGINGSTLADWFAARLDRRVATGKDSDQKLKHVGDTSG